MGWLQPNTTTTTTITHRCLALKGEAIARANAKKTGHQFPSPHLDDIGNGVEGCVSLARNENLNSETLPTLATLGQAVHGLKVLPHFYLINTSDDRKVELCIGTGTAIDLR